MSLRADRFATENLSVSWYKPPWGPSPVTTFSMFPAQQETSLQRGVTSYICRIQHLESVSLVPVFGTTRQAFTMIHCMACTLKVRYLPNLECQHTFSKSSFVVSMLNFHVKIWWRFPEFRRSCGSNMPSAITRLSRLHWNGLLETNSRTGQHAGATSYHQLLEISEKDPPTKNDGFHR